jgi:YVTN family beta-propeller protein
LYGGTAYVPPFQNRVAVLNTATLQITSIDLPAPAASLAISSDGRRLYTSYTTTISQVGVIDTSNKTIVSNIPLGCDPIISALSPDDSTLYLANGPACVVDIFNPATGRLTGSVEALGPGTIAVLPNATRAYIYTGLANLWVLDARTFERLAVISPPCCLTGWAPVASPDSSLLYVENNLGVMTYDTATDQLIGSVSVANYPGAMAISRDGARLFIGSSSEPLVTVVDTASQSVATTINIGTSYVEGIAANPTQNLIYVVGYSLSGSTETVLVIDSQSLQVIASVPLAVLHPPTFDPTHINPSIGAGSMCTSCTAHDARR